MTRWSCRIRFIRQTRRWNLILWSSEIIRRLSGQVRFCRTCRSISCSRYSMARSTYSFLLEKVSGMLFPPGMMGTIFPSALCPTNESRGIICRRNTETSDQQVNLTVLLFHTNMERQPAQLSGAETSLMSYRINKFAKFKFFIMKHKPAAVVQKRLLMFSCGHRDSVCSLIRTSQWTVNVTWNCSDCLWIIKQNIYSQNCFYLICCSSESFPLD